MNVFIRILYYISIYVDVYIYIHPRLRIIQYHYITMLIFPNLFNRFPCPIQMYMMRYDVYTQI